MNRNVPLMKREIFKSEFINIRGVEYHLRLLLRNPSNPWLIMLHGFLGSGEQFESAAARITGDVNICLPDLIGFGKTNSDAGPVRYIAEEQVADWLSILDSSFSGQHVILHGYSMGGRLAIRIALAMMDRGFQDQMAQLSGLIIESSTPGIRSKTDRLQRAKLDDERADAILSDFVQFLTQWATLPVFSAGKSSDTLERIQSSTDPKSAAASLRGFGSGRVKPVWDRLSILKVPVLLMAGEHDSKFCRIAAETAGLLPDPTLRIIPDAGHRIHLDNEDAYILTINQWIRNHARWMNR